MAVKLSAMSRTSRTLDERCSSTSKSPRATRLAASPISVTGAMMRLLCHVPRAPPSTTLAMAVPIRGLCSAPSSAPSPAEREPSTIIDAVTTANVTSASVTNSTSESAVAILNVRFTAGFASVASARSRSSRLTSSPPCTPARAPWRC